MTRPALLLCTDMDRTLLPNGDADESPQAMDLLSRLVSRVDVQLAYVSGRDRKLVEQAIDEYHLPRADFVIGDVGTNIYTVDGQHWLKWNDWHDEIQHSWRGLTHDELHRSLSEIDGLQLQEEAKQNRFKLSYYVPGDVDTDALLQEVRQLLADLNIDYNAVWSIDETLDQGLLDILPAAASKYHAIDYLLRRTGCDVNNTVFAGDSGNDIDVLCSPLHAVLVANATNEVRQQAQHLAMLRGYENALYIARGGYLGMNGNYAAGILEGIQHYHPELVPLQEGDYVTA
jgi:HAD superfamily hydrolase (TIGR01484 family)